MTSEYRSNYLRRSANLQVSEVHWVVLPEQDHADVGVEVEEHEEDDGDEGDAAEAADQRLDDDAKLGQRLDELQDAQQPQEAEHGENAPKVGQEGQHEDEAGGDDEEVEAVPRVVKVVQWTVSLCDDFHHDCTFKIHRNRQE